MSYSRPALIEKGSNSTKPSPPTPKSLTLQKPWLGQWPLAPRPTWKWRLGRRFTWDKKLLLGQKGGQHPPKGAFWRLLSIQKPPINTPWRVLDTVGFFVFPSLRRFISDFKTTFTPAHPPNWQTTRSSPHQAQNKCLQNLLLLFIYIYIFFLNQKNILGLKEIRPFGVICLVNYHFKRLSFWPNAARTPGSALLPRGSRGALLPLLGAQRATGGRELGGTGALPGRKGEERRRGGEEGSFCWLFFFLVVFFLVVFYVFFFFFFFKGLVCFFVFRGLF